MREPMTELELTCALDRADDLVRRCASGEMQFGDFVSQYNNFFWAYALDGHEANPAEIALFAKLRHRIAPHEAVAQSILAKLCSDNDASKTAYLSEGRFGSQKALERLKEIAASIPGLSRDVVSDPTSVSGR
ncbi:hypothetical protein LA521A_18870 [Lysobacter auxotrophicus]|uniref:Uncharacterized protein n=2 Tax=Lysobacter auxotrophicus TaxID=2992573 RepID=A0ABM8DDL2_9GAMM|nr:hypothetical protein LA521A_18870 [Lysobacter auxotrophicus]